MRILVTGGAGFVGSHLTGRLLSEGHDVVVLDNFDDYYGLPLKKYNVSPFLGNPKFMLVRGSILNDESLSEVFTKNIDLVFHLAAEASIRVPPDCHVSYFQTNALGTLKLLEACRSCGVRRFIFASSSCVYGNISETPFRETDPSDHPISIYAASKKTNELHAHVYHSLYGIECIGLRFFSIYGPSGRPDMAPFVFTHSIDEGKEIKRFGDGTMMRDYTYVDDVIDGMIASIDVKAQYEIFNLGTESMVTINELISIIERYLGKKAIIKTCPIPPGDVTITRANIGKARKMLGYNPKVTIEEGMGRFIDWYKQHKHLYETHNTNPVL